MKNADLRSSIKDFVGAIPDIHVLKGLLLHKNPHSQWRTSEYLVKRGPNHFIKSGEVAVQLTSARTHTHTHTHMHTHTNSYTDMCTYTQTHAQT